MAGPVREADYTCCICMSDDDSPITVLLCGHRFHDSCLCQYYLTIDSRRNMRCFVCRLDRADMNILAARVVEPAATRARVLVTCDTDVLLVQEHSRVWNLPGGGLEETDRHQGMEAIEACARRELLEETGLDPRRFEWLGFVERHAVYVANVPRLSWPIIMDAYRQRRPTTEIRGVWWGALEAALAEPSVDDRTKLALAMWRSLSD
jgi:8-oxo-dGTP pyrophosphatase MutT (NUDIX family)